MEESARARLGRALEGARMRQGAEQFATTEARQAAAQSESARHNRAAEDQARAALGADAWTITADPVQGGLVRMNRKTGEVQPATPSAGSPAGGPPAFGKLTEGDRTKLEGVQEMLSSFGRMRELEGGYYPVGGMGEQASGVAASLGLRAVQPKDHEQRQAAWNAVLVPVLKAASGQAVTPSEAARSYSAYIPRASESFETWKGKVDALFDKASAGALTLPKPLRDHYLPQIEQAKASMPQTAADYRAEVEAVRGRRKGKGGAATQQGGRSDDPLGIR
jgi:hypothetical protein